jgi:hypothetical protein
MNEQMTINEKELVELLEDDIFAARIVRETFSDNPDDDDIFVELEAYTLGFATVTLEWNGGQEYFVYASNCDEMFPGETISVNEILDIVL